MQPLDFGLPDWKVGTSGWNYAHWKEVFYPPDVATSKWLDYYSGHFDTVEVNATFYRLPKASTFESWYERTPGNFIWAVKGNKFITHTRRLKDSIEPLQRLYTSAKKLKEKLGPILFQLPPTLSFDRDLFVSFCGNLDRAHRHALEVRHDSWIDDQVFGLLRAYNIAFCISDTAGRYPYHEAITADFIYIRLHGSQKLYASEYAEQELQEWAQRIKHWNMETYLYFDNDYQGYAIKNAQRFKEILHLS